MVAVYTTSLICTRQNGSVPVRHFALQGVWCSELQVTKPGKVYEKQNIEWRNKVHSTKTVAKFPGGGGGYTERYNNT